MKIFSVVPVIKDKPKIIKIIKKRTVVIECTVASKFEPKCTWVKEENEIFESIKHVYLVQQSKEGEFIVKLEINNIEETDKGAYKLIARNEKGEAISQIVNLVDIPEEEAKPSKPEIFQKLTDMMVGEARTFELMIILTRTDKKCKVTWYKETTVIKETKDITTTFDGKTARLTFSRAQMEYTGVYKVVVTNEMGHDESSAKITVCKIDEKKKKEDEERKKEKARQEEEEKRRVSIRKYCVLYVVLNVVFVICYVSETGGRGSHD